MTKILHTAKHGGQTFKRTTEGRTFTHVVLARSSYEHALAFAALPSDSRRRISEVERKQRMGVYDRFEVLAWTSGSDRAEELRLRAEGRSIYDSVVVVEADRALLEKGG